MTLTVWTYKIINSKLSTIFVYYVCYGDQSKNKIADNNIITTIKKFNI